LEEVKARTAKVTESASFCHVPENAQEKAAGAYDASMGWLRAMLPFQGMEKEEELNGYARVPRVPASPPPFSIP
jgi:hypothetical protein